MEEKRQNFYWKKKFSLKQIKKKKIPEAFLGLRGKNNDKNCKKEDHGHGGQTMAIQHTSYFFPSQCRTEAIVRKKKEQNALAN